MRAQLIADRKDGGAVVKMLFGAYITCLVLLPSGSIYGVNFKFLLFVPLLFECIILLTREEDWPIELAFMSAVGLLFLLWAIHSLFNPFYAAWAFSQYKDVITTLLGCLFIRVLTKSEESRFRFVRLCIYTVALGSLLKLTTVLYSLRTGVPVSDLVDRVSSIFGVKLMTVELGDIGGRLQFPSDNLLPIVVFALVGLRRKLRIGAVMALLLMFLLLLSSLYTFSRYLWACTALAFLLGMLVSLRDKLHLFYLCTLGASIAYFYKGIYLVFELRFSSALAGSSDQTRIWQIADLKSFFLDSPIFGHGMGSYVLQNVRSVDLPYAYEVQILALAGEFGMVGITVFAVLLLNYYRKAFSFEEGVPMFQASVCLMLLSFLGAGLFNPCLLVSMSSVSYGLLFVLGLIGSCRKDSLNPVSGSSYFRCKPPTAAH